MTVYDDDALLLLLSLPFLMSNPSLNVSNFFFILLHQNSKNLSALWQHSKRLTEREIFEQIAIPCQNDITMIWNYK